MWLRAVIYELSRASLTDTDFYVFMVLVVGYYCFISLLQKRLKSMR